MTFSVNGFNSTTECLGQFLLRKGGVRSFTVNVGFQHYKQKKRVLAVVLFRFGA